MRTLIQDSEGQARACVLWMHGLGADASDMLGLAQELGLPNLRHVFLNAPIRPVTLNQGMHMPAWYDIVGFELQDREDEAGIVDSQAQIQAVIAEQIQAGFTEEQVFLAGFSQGGAMALHTALNTPARFGGVIALSAYLPMATKNSAQLHKDTPFFLGSGQFDPIVVPQWTELSYTWLLEHGYERISHHQYPMEHSVCLQEMNDIRLWLGQIIGEVA